MKGLGMTVSAEYKEAKLWAEGFAAKYRWPADRALLMSWAQAEAAEMEWTPEVKAKWAGQSAGFEAYGRGLDA